MNPPPSARTSRGPASRRFGVLLLAAALGVAPTVGWGQGATWTGAKSTAWSTSSNWNPASVPNSESYIYIDANSGNEPVISSGVASGNAVYVGLDPSSGSKTSLEIENGAALDDNITVIAYESGATGAQTISGKGTRNTVSESMWVGYNGTGRLTLSAGGSLASEGGVLGFNPGASGTATVTGSDSVWSAGSYMYLGYGGQGTLNVASGGQVNIAGGNIYVGDDGGGSLNVSGGARVSDIFGVIADAGTGSAVITGSGTLWNNQADVLVGGNGTGNLTISAGAGVTCGNFDVAVLSASSGTVLVTGAGSKLTASGELLIGETGPASLTVAQGGAVNAAQQTSVGYLVGGSASLTVSGNGSAYTESANFFDGDLGTGSVLVTGSGAKLVVAQALAVGSNATGNLSVVAGGNVSTGLLYVGNNPGTNGSLLASGSGTRLNIAQTSYVGNQSPGNVTIAGGAAATGNFCYVGVYPGISGNLTVTGAGSSLRLSNGVAVGGYGEGNLTVSDGGGVSAPLTYIGYNPGDFGQITVTGTGSTLVGTNITNVGYNGTGVLTVANGGVAEFEYYVVMAYAAGANGTLNLNPGGTVVMTNAGGLTAGNGTYTLNFAGGTVAALGAGLTSLLNATLVNGTNTTFDSGDSTLGWLGNLTGGGGLAINGTGYVVLDGNNTYTGGTLVEEGLLFVDDSANNTAVGTGPVTVLAAGGFGGNGHVTVPVADAGSLAPTSPDSAEAILNFDQGLTLANTSDCILTIGGNTTPGTDYDQVNVTGNLALTGNLMIVLEGGFQPSLGDSFQLLQASGGISGAFAAYNLPTLTPGRGWDTSALATNGTLRVVPVPIIGTAPASATVKAGAGVTFRVSATGIGTLTYQWYFKGQPIALATNATLSLTGVTPANAGAYTVAVTDGNGRTTTSGAATLTVVVTVAPKITTQPAKVTAKVGATIKLKIAATGTAPLSYQWRRNNVKLVNGGKISGATTAALTITKAAAANAGSYLCVVTNAAGSATSKTAVVTIK